MSRVGRIRKTEGATAAPKKIGGPSARASASRWKTSTSVNRPGDGRRETGDETGGATDPRLSSLVCRLPSTVYRLVVFRSGGVLRGDCRHEPGVVRAIQE